MLVDDYGGYKALFSKTASPCTELGCWAHAPQILRPAQANASTVAYEVLQRIGGLYAAEAEGKHLSTEARQILRAEKACRSCNRCTTGYCKPAPKLPMAAAPPKPSITP
ncbi:MAG: transposase [Nitrosomonas sp.]|nr:transposase [Nitrosomonas sp.]